MTPAGFRRSDAILHTTFEVPTPSEQVRLVVARTAVWIADATARALHEVVDHCSEVEVSLVDSGALDARDDLCHRVPDDPRVLPIQRVAGANEDGGRAAPKRLGRAHRRVDPELARGVVRGRHDPSPVWIATDDEWLRAQLRILELLDRGEEGVEIEVREDRHAGRLVGYGTLG